MQKAFLVLTAALVLAVTVYVSVVPDHKQAIVLMPRTLPSVVDESLEHILRSLEAELEKHDPQIIAALSPGITAEELANAETVLGASLHPEMQALYRWHNGLANGAELFPGHEFWSLEEAIQSNKALTAAFRESGFSDIMAHEENWLSLFPDGAGDGYYYDPKHSYENGGVFYHFREVGDYMYFPSVKNLLMAIVECYQAGVYKHGETTAFELENQIMRKYGMQVQE